MIESRKDRTGAGRLQSAAVRGAGVGEGVMPPTASQAPDGLRAIVSSFWAQSLVCMAIAAAIRIAFLARAHGMIDGDEAVLGIQAEQILHGAYPIYFAGQPYQGTLVAYLAAPLVALLGPNAWALRIPPLLESLALIPMLGALAERLYGARARLPALILAAGPPLYVAVNEMRFWGGTIETILLGTAAMLVAVVVCDRIAAGQPIFWLAAGLGLLAGGAFWVTPLSMDYLASLAVWALPLAAWRLWRRSSAGISLPRVAAPVALGLGGALVGFSPALVYAAQNAGANFTWLARGGQLAGGAVVAPIADPLRGGVLDFLLARGLPRLTGSYPYWTPLPPIHLLQHVGLAFTGVALIYAIARLADRLAPARQNTAAAAYAAWKLALAPLLLLIVAVAYWRSSFSNGYIFPFDRTGRYLLPAVTALILVVAHFFGDLPALLVRASQELRAWRAARMVWLSEGQTVRLAWVIAAIALAGLIGANLLPYTSADAQQAMQSPYRQFDAFPAVDGQIVAYLEQHHIRYLWGDHWLNYVIEYLSDGKVIAADYDGNERFPEHLSQVAHADRPSYLIQADPAAGECDAARMLDAMHVTYLAVPFLHHWLLTPLSRTVQPSELAPALQAHY